MIRDRTTPVFLLEGKDKLDGTAVRILYIGERRNREYLRRMIFGENGAATQLGTAKGAIHSAWRRFANDVDVVVIRENRKIDAFSAQSFFIVPVWMDVVRDMDRVFERFESSKSGKQDIRRITKAGYDYKITQEPEDFDRFFFDMYLPYIRNRHDEASMPITYEQMQANVPRSELLLVTKDEEAVGGTMLVYGEDQVHSWKIGVKGGDTALVKQAVVTAAYVFEAKYLRAKGVNRVNQGGTRAFLRDGQFAFKKKWGILLDRPWQQYFCIKAPRPTPGARAFLAHNPFLHIVDDEYHAAAFIPDSATISRHELDKLVKECTVNGIRGLSLYCLAGDRMLIDTSTLEPNTCVRDASALWPTAASD